MKSTIVGVDVGKYELVIYRNNQYFTIKNEEIALKKWLNKYCHPVESVALIVYEPTGGYERTLYACLEEKHLPYRRVHANRVRDYAKSTGRFAKTDRIDAKVLAEYAQRMEIQPKAVKAVEPGLKSLLTRREQLIQMRLQDKNRLESCDEILREWIQKNLQQLTSQLKDLEQAIKSYESEHAEVKRLLTLYTSVPGIGRVTGLQLIVDLPELLQEKDKTLAALVGVAPWNHDSGSKIGRRRTRGGRTRIRGLLYMAALVAARCDADMKRFYTKLKQKGKASKVALIAVAHKLLAIIRSVAQRQTPWEPILNRH